MAAAGRRVTFHGAFSHKADAVRKERQVGGFIRPAFIRGSGRYLVLTRTNPAGAVAYHGYLITPHGFGRRGFFITKDGATIQRHVLTLQQAKAIIALLAGWRNPKRRASTKEVMARYNPRTVWAWPASLKTFPTLPAARAHARAVRGTGGAFLSRLSDGRYGVATLAEARKRGWV